MKSKATFNKTDFKPVNEFLDSFDENKPIGLMYGAYGYKPDKDGKRRQYYTRLTITKDKVKYLNFGYNFDAKVVPYDCPIYEEFEYDAKDCIIWDNQKNQITVWPVDSIEKPIFSMVYYYIKKVYRDQQSELVPIENE